MKSYCKGLAITRDFVEAAYMEWLAGESGHKNRYRIAEEHGCADNLIDEIWQEISERRLRFKPIHRYSRYEPTNGKLRVVGIESVKQQVCDYVAICALEPLLETKAGFYQTACAKGKGQRMCRDAIRKWSRLGGYFCKIDVRQCYPSLKQGVVKRLLRKYVRSADVLYLCDALLDTYDDGLEIGSYFSLKMASLVLSFAYHRIEDLHKVRRGKRHPMVTHQLWHLDDALLMSDDKRCLKQAVRSVDRYLSDEFGLSIKPWKICRLSRDEPLDMGGWIACDGRVWLRKGIFLRGRKAFRLFARKPSYNNATRVVSYWGWFSNGDLDDVIENDGMRPLFAKAKAIIRSHDRAVARRRGGDDGGDSGGLPAWLPVGQGDPQRGAHI